VKKIISLLLVLCTLLSVCAVGFADDAAAEEAPAAIADGRDRPSVCGNLQVLDGKLCSEDGTPVMLRGVSSYGISVAERYINKNLFLELSAEYGVNVFRLAMYTYGTGSVGYCTGGDKRRLKKTVANGVEYAKEADMYAIIDWHVLQDQTPMTYIEDAKAFFDEMSAQFADYNNVLYEICNEPNNCSWGEIKQYANEIIPVIRANDPDSVIIVGTPNWSQRVDEAAVSPLEYDNLMYTLHFYSATHKDDLRSIARNASQSGLPIFVTEYGVTSSSGGFPLDLEEGDKWIDLLEEEGISYCNWSFSNVPEACSSILYACKKLSGYAPEDFSESGAWVMNTIKTRS